MGALALMGWLRARHPQRETPAGLQAASRWLGVRAALTENPVFATHSPLQVELWSRLLAYGAALGIASGASRPLPMGVESDTHAWSAYGDAGARCASRILAPGRPVGEKIRRPRLPHRWSSRWARFLPPRLRPVASRGRRVRRGPRWPSPGSESCYRSPCPDGRFGLGNRGRGDGADPSTAHVRRARTTTTATTSRSTTAASDRIRAWRIDESALRASRAGRIRSLPVSPATSAACAGSSPPRAQAPPVRLAGVTLPKRFPDRDAIADLRAATDGIEAGAQLEETRRLAGRVMARREMGKLVFLDLVDRSGRIQLMCDTGRAGEVDVHLGDVVGVGGTAGEVAAGRAVARGRRARRCSRRTGARCRTPSTASPTRETRYRKRYLDLLMNDGLARALPAPGADRLGDPPLPGRGWLRRGRDADPAAALRRGVRPSLRHALTRARRRPLPADRDRALPQAPDRRRARARLRDRQGLPQRERLVQAPARVHDARVVRGVRGLPGHDGADRGLIEQVAREVLGTTRVTFKGEEIST